MGSIYHHFGNRDGIVAALFFESVHDQSRSVQATMPPRAGRACRLWSRASGSGVAQPERARFLFQARRRRGRRARARTDLAEAAAVLATRRWCWFEPPPLGGLRDPPCELMPSLGWGRCRAIAGHWLSGNAAPGGLPSPTTYRTDRPRPALAGPSGVDR